MFLFNFPGQDRIFSSQTPKVVAVKLWWAISKHVISTNKSNIFLSQLIGVQYAIKVQHLHWKRPVWHLGPLPWVSFVVSSLFQFYIWHRMEFLWTHKAILVCVVITTKQYRLSQKQFFCACGVPIFWFTFHSHFRQRSNFALQSRNRWLLVGEK